MSRPSKGRAIAGWILIVLVFIAMAGSAIMKLTGTAPQEIMEGMRRYGLADKIVLIGVLEMVSGILLLIPRTASFGVLMASGFWGGAICTHLAHNEYGEGALPVVLLLMSWLGAALRHPEVLGSFTRRQ